MRRTPMVLLPGMDGLGTLHEAFIAALGAAFDVQRVRYPVDEPLGYDALEARVRATLPAGDVPWLVLGESFSGPLAIALAASRPPGLAGVVLCASFAAAPASRLAPIARRLPPMRMPTPLARFFGGRVLGRWSTPALREAFADATTRVAPAVMTRRLRAIFTVDAMARLREITVPLLLLEASDDVLVPPLAGDAIVGVLPHARREVIEGPHFLLQAAPLACAGAVRRFAAATDDEGGGDGGDAFLGRTA